MNVETYQNSQNFAASQRIWYCPIVETYQLHLKSKQYVIAASQRIWYCPIVETYQLHLKNKQYVIAASLKRFIVSETQQCVFICRKHWYVSTGLLPFLFDQKNLLPFVFRLYPFLIFATQHLTLLTFKQTLKNRNILNWHIIINHSVCYLFGNALKPEKF